MGEDRSWPSAALSEIAMSRFAQHRHPHPYRHISYHNPGHLIAPPPYGPTTDTIVPGPGVTFLMGEHHRTTPQPALMPGYRPLDSLRNTSQ
ncbi:MAG: acyl-CoA thioester hydrolase/BAAT C-terminal domain-containing protein [Ktedonobacterales bacterium]